MSSSRGWEQSRGQVPDAGRSSLSFLVTMSVIFQSRHGSKEAHCVSADGAHLPD